MAGHAVAPPLLPLGLQQRQQPDDGRIATRQPSGGGGGGGGRKRKVKLTYRAALRLMDRYGAKGRASQLFVMALCVVTAIAFFAVTTQDGVQYNQSWRRENASLWWYGKLGDRMHVS